MNVKVHDVMQTPVFTLQRHNTVADARRVAQERSVSAIPIVGSNNELLGIVSKTDLFEAEKEGTPLSSIMTDGAYAVPEYNDASVAARVMRKHGIHHVVVTHEKKVVGIVSSFDMLQLVEDHRFVMKPGPKNKSKNKKNKKDKKKNKK